MITYGPLYHLCLACEASAAKMPCKVCHNIGCLEVSRSVYTGEGPAMRVDQEKLKAWVERTFKKEAAP